MSEKQEIALMRRLAAGDQQAFAVLYEQYSGVSYSFVLSLVKDSSLSKDIVHDVFVKLWLKRETLTKVLSFNRYLYQMLKNAVYDHFSAMQVSRHYIDEITNFRDDYSDITQSAISMNELQMLIFEAVSRMPEKRREVFRMSRYQNVENKEIARRLNIDVRTVENHITNALSDIRKYITEAYAEADGKYLNTLCNVKITGLMYDGVSCEILEEEL